MTVHNLFKAIAAITKYDIAKQIKRKQTAKRVGAALTGMSMLAPAAAVGAVATSAALTGCKNVVTETEYVNVPTHDLITVPFTALEKRINVEGTSDLFTAEVMDKLYEAFANFDVLIGGPREHKVKTWCDMPGAKIVLERTSNYAETDRAGVVLKVNIDYINNTADTDYIYQKFQSKIVNIVDNPISALGNQLETVRLAQIGNQLGNAKVPGYAKVPRKGAWHHFLTVTQRCLLRCRVGYARVPGTILPNGRISA